VRGPACTKRSLLAAIQRSAATGNSLSERAVDELAAADLDDETRASLAWLLLRAAPAQEFRSDLQTMALESVPRSGYNCVIPRRLDYGMACVSRAVIRRAEYEDMAALRDVYFSFLRRLHPRWRIMSSRVTVNHPKVPVFAFRPVHDLSGGELLRAAKDWGDPGKGHAGAEVVLSLVELPTVVVAAHLLTEPSRVSVAPVPASPWSPSQPGQASERIAIDAAVLSGRAYLDALAKTGSGIECTEPGHDRAVIVVDDQLTTGGSASASVAALTRAGFDVRAVITWSTSRRHWTGAPAIDSRCWLSDARWLLGRGSACGPNHTDAVGADVRETATYLDALAV
jgi:hypothetical protein